MKKQLGVLCKLFSALTLLLLFACGGSDNSGRATADAPTFPAAEAEGEKDVLHQMPNSEQITEAYEDILEKAGADDPELMEIYISFSRSIASPENDGAHMSVQMVSPQDKNKVVQYQYDFGKKEVEGPREVTLSSGLGAKEEFVDTYDGFKDVLFRKADVMDFDEADAVYEKAVAKSGYAPKDCYVDNLQFKYSPRVGLKGQVDVQSTRITSASRHYSVEKDGTVIDE